MKNNILNHFALNDLKKHKKDSLLLTITIFVVALITMVLTFVSPIIFNQDYIKHQEEKGSYEYVTTFNDTQDINNTVLKLNEEKINIKDSRLTTCRVISAGITFNEETMNELQGDSDIIAVRLATGRMPKNKSEVAVKESVFDHWGYPKEINSTIKISYVVNNETYVNEFNVVGILEERGNTDIAVSSLTHQWDYSLYIKTSQQDSILTSDDMEILYEGYDRIPDVEKIAQICTLIQAIIMIIAFTILYGLNLAAFEKRERDYALLRSIGTTKKQIYYIIFVQSLLISILPILLAIASTYLFSFVIPNLVKLPLVLTFNIVPILLNAGMVIGVSFVSHFMSARSACRKAIMGTFEGQEFQYFYYQYKKLNNLKPLYLGWRQLVSLKKNVFVKMVFLSIIVVLSMQIIGDGMIRRSLINENIKYVNSANNTLSYSLVDMDNTSFNANDFEFYQSYCEEIRIINCIETGTLSTRYMETNPMKDYPDLYGFDERVKSKFGIKDIKVGQIIVTTRFLDDCYPDKYNVHDNILFLGDKYEIIEIEENDFENIAIVNKEDFQRYGSLNTDQIATVVIKDVHHKTKVLLEKAKEIYKVKDKYYQTDSLLKVQKLMYENESKTVDESSIWVKLMVVICVSMIYIYQFAFELNKQKENIGTYQLLGFRRIEICKIYFYKSLIIGLLGFVLGFLCYCLDSLYFLENIFKEHFLYNTSLLVSTSSTAIIVILVLVIISLYPLIGILKQDGFENKNTRE